VGTSTWAQQVGTDLLVNGWTTATLGNSWTAFGGSFATPGYQLRAGVVYLQGCMHSGTTSTTVFTLPVGSRPLAAKVFNTNSNSAGFAEVEILASGVLEVLAYGGTGSNASVFLDGISFIAEQ